MPSLLNEFLNSNKFRRASDSRNLVLYIFTIIILAITWSGIKAVQNNYELQKKIAKLQQSNQVTELQNGNISLQNEYYKTDQYLEIAARQQLGLAARGETVLLVPERVAKKYVAKDAVPSPVKKVSSDQGSTISKNFKAWRDFLFGHKLSTDK